ncbi:MAG TPA: 6,7-dimethyl-8-ribityllumazine synthase [Solirubrobacteraceae bacterium]|jgi:6,7-dimethyl-8-ribityllumazine synthase|nr:6,7-dimethyl-8-ribityllumazine synthase [Solirubrobacteraceae bacterium]
MDEHNRIAYVQASWHDEILDRGQAAFLAALDGHGLAADHVDVVRVPGAFELPLHVRRLARTGRYSAIVGAALVVDGGIYRHEFVAEAVVGGLMQVQLETDVPVLSLVLTPHHFHEHEVHSDFFATHFEQKGAEVAHACALTLESLAHLERLANAD